MQTQNSVALYIHGTQISRLLDQSSSIDTATKLQLRKIRLEGIDMYIYI